LDSDSVASGLRRILQVRKEYGIATSEQLDVPRVSNKAMLVMVHRLRQDHQVQVTVLNFCSEPISGSVLSEHLVSGGTVIDMFTSEPIGEVDDLHSFAVSLEPHQGLSLLIVPPADDEQEADELVGQSPVS
jgi:hypothetical protein